MPPATVEDAIKSFEQHSEFARVQCEIYERTRNLTGAAGPAAWPGTVERRECALRLFAIRATAFLDLVTDNRRQADYCVLLAALEPLAWQDFMGHPPNVLVPNGPRSLAFVEEVHAEAQRFANEGYKRVANKQSGAGSQTGTKSETDGKATTRERVEAFLAAASGLAESKVTKAMFWRAAGYTEATQFEDFQEDRPRTTKIARQNFERQLAMSPDRFIGLLTDKKLLR
jgi:hypothetical protein